MKRPLSDEGRLSPSLTSLDSPSSEGAELVYCKPLFNSRSTASASVETKNTSFP